MSPADPVPPSSQWCVVARTGNAHEIDGVAAVYGPFANEHIAVYFCQRMNLLLKTASDAERYADNGPFAWVAPDGFMTVPLQKDPCVS